MKKTKTSKSQKLIDFYFCDYCSDKVFVITVLFCIEGIYGCNSAHISTLLLRYCMFQLQKNGRTPKMLPHCAPTIRFRSFAEYTILKCISCRVMGQFVKASMEPTIVFHKNIEETWKWKISERLRNRKLKKICCIKEFEKWFFGKIKKVIFGSVFLFVFVLFINRSVRA